MKILLIAGGWSTEREVSLSGARAIAATLEQIGHKVTRLDLLDGFDQVMALAGEHDFAFLNLHGSPGEDGLVQALLERAGCPYQGSGPAGSYLALNKAAAKQVFRKAGLPTADWDFVPAPPTAYGRGEYQPTIPYPLFVKSNTGGSSLHTARAGNRAELDAALAEIFAAGCGALVEPELRGRELTCGVLGDQALPPVLIEPVSGQFFDFKSKYEQGGAREICPAPVSARVTARAGELALATHRALGLDGYSRTDFILDADDELTILEVNTLPGMTATSLVPQEAAALGMDFAALLTRLIELGLARHKLGRA